MSSLTDSQIIPSPAEILQRIAARDLERSQRLLLRAAEALTPPLHPKIEEDPHLALEWALKGFQALTLRPARHQLVEEAIAAEMQERYPGWDGESPPGGWSAEQLRDIYTAAAARLEGPG